MQNVSEDVSQLGGSAQTLKQTLLSFSFDFICTDLTELFLCLNTVSNKKGGIYFHPTNLHQSLLLDVFIHVQPYESTPYTKLNVQHWFQMGFSL